MGMIRRWHSNSLAEKTTEIYICGAYPSSITRNWLVFRYQEIEFRFHPRVESRGWRFVRNQTRPLPASKIRFPYPKAHLRQFASLCLSFPSFPQKSHGETRPLFAVANLLPPMTTGHPTANTGTVFDERKVHRVLSYRGERSENGSVSAMKGARLTRSSRRRGSIERSGSRGDRWSVPRYRSARFDNAARTSLCLSIIGALNKGNRLRCRGHRRRTSLSTVRRALSSWTHRNWPRLIDARQFSSWPLHRRGSFSKRRGEGLAHGGTQGKRFVSASGRHVDPVNLHFLEMENGGCGKKKGATNRFVIPRWNLDARSKRSCIGSIRGSFERWKRRFESLVNNKACTSMSVYAYIGIWQKVQQDIFCWVE